MELDFNDLKENSENIGGEKCSLLVESNKNLEEKHKEYEVKISDL